jgi:hypothetical protein
MADLHVDHFAGLQLVARGQRFFQRGGGVAAMQPVAQQRLLAGVVQAQQLGQRGSDRGVAARPRRAGGE